VINGGSRIILAAGALSLEANHLEQIAERLQPGAARHDGEIGRH